MNNIVEWKANLDNPIYLFSSNGDVKNTKTVKLVSDSSTNEYIRATIINKNNGKNTIMIHQIIAKFFVDNPKNFNFIKHIVGIKYKNLEKYRRMLKYFFVFLVFLIYNENDLKI